MKNSYFIYGKHAVLAALDNKERKIYEVLSTPENFRFIPKHIKSKEASNTELKMLLPNILHQGIAAKVAPITHYNIPKLILAKANSKIVILDQVTDPQNLGAILRSAAAFNIDAIICPKHGSAVENGTVAKSACGALDKVNLVEVVNITSTIGELKKNGFWVIGLDSHPIQTIDNARNLFDSKLCIVMGSEGKGMRNLVTKACDLLIKIPISDKMESLNVSNAATIIMWEIFKNI